MEIPMANDKIILKAEDLDGYLTNEDLNDLKHMDELFKETMKSFEPKNEEKIIQGYDLMGHEMQKICEKHPNIKVYSFVTYLYKSCCYRTIICCCAYSSRINI